MNTSVQSFHSSGKFLITAEYLILKGAKGLAIPLKFGQTLTIKENQSEHIEWHSVANDTTWFEVVLNTKEFQIVSTNNTAVAETLKNIFTQIRTLNYSFLLKGCEAEIEADFNLSWGLGSSSTLINNLAMYAKVDPYLLLSKTFGGSGYDIACASANGPITYQLKAEDRKIENVNFNPSFASNIFFVYLGKKMNSRTGMSYFNTHAVYSNHDMEEVNEITDFIISATTREEFEHQLIRHELLLSSILQQPTIKESSFPDYPHVIKSMGAWGGDFVMVTGNHLEDVKKYFHQKGLDTILPFNEMVKI